MLSMNLEIWVALLILAAMPVAMITDLSARRIPNLLTFPFLAAAVVARIHFQGWPGLALALTGAAFAPFTLALLHGGRGPGMGDLKLAAGVGAALGPITAVVSMLATAIIGGVLAFAWMMKPGGMLADLIPACVPLTSRLRKNVPAEEPDADEAKASDTLPYAVAIGLGAFLVMAVRLWTDHDLWFL